MTRLFAQGALRSCFNLSIAVTVIALAGSCLLGVTPPSFSAQCVDQVQDIHGDPAAADLVVFAGGNEWFALPEIFRAFQAAHPEVVHIYYETLPPGTISAQIAAGSLTLDDLVLAPKPDVLIGGQRGIAAMVAGGSLRAPAVTFASNVLGIMVRAGNPKHILKLADLGRPDVRVAMPNPKTEGISRQIEAAYRKAGGDALDRMIMETKVAAGTTTITTIHHRQTPMWLLQGKVDAGPVWITEARYQERIQSGLMGVVIPSDVNSSGSYQAAPFVNAPHAAAAAAFVQFLASPQAQAIYHSYGFLQPQPIEE